MTPRLRRACEKAAHVVTTRGKIVRGGQAAMFLLERVWPRPWRFVARLFARPPLVWPINLGYEIVARHRSFFAPFILPGEPEDRPENLPEDLDE